jgi:hypothetical protein
LSVIKRALPNLPSAAPAKELEERILGAEDRREADATTHSPAAATGAGTALQQAVDMDVQPEDVHQPDSVDTSAIQHMAIEVADTPAALPATRLSPRPGKRKEPVQMVTYRIPASLYDRLFRIAEYNNLNMTDIVVEAIERHLPNFPQPPRG